MLAVFGLAPARTATAQAQLIEELKVRSLALRTKADEAAARAKSLEFELKQQKKLAERSQVVVEKLQLRDAAVAEMSERLAQAERELAAVREYLMAVEVKLDILEGAANVLDVRTRTANREQPRQTGAPV